MARWPWSMLAVTISLMKYVHLQTMINQKDCGRGGEISNILYGQPISKEKIPWIVYLKFVHTRDGEHIIYVGCGGSIIARSFIMTAAACFRKVPKAVFKSVRVYYNSTVRGKGPMVLADFYKVHPSYKHYTEGDNIALLHVSHPLQLDKFVWPVCVSKSTNDMLNYRKVVAAGWGTRDFGGVYSNRLRYTVLKVLPNDECQQGYKDTKYKNLREQQIFCTRTPNKDVCVGDGGGPVTRLRKSPGNAGNNKRRWTQVGIVSFTYQCNSTGIPSGHTRVSSYWEWIDHEMRRYDFWDRL